MKKIFTLLTAFLLAVGFAQAQNVFFAGQSSESTKVWKNNILIYNWSDTSTPFVNDAYFDENGDTYLAGYCSDTLLQSAASVWKNDALLTTVPFAAFNCILLKDDALYTAGFMTDTVHNHSIATVWGNGEILFTPSDPNLDASIHAICFDDEGNLLSAGYQLNPDWTSKAIIWRNNDTLFVLDAENADILDMQYHNSDVYAAGYVQEAANTFATLWKNDEIIFQIDSTYSKINALCHYDDTLYFAGQVNEQLVVWKDSEILYAIDVEGDAIINNLIVNEFGIYCVGKSDGLGAVWRNGTMLYQPEACTNIVGAAVFPACDGLTRTLPWSDDFEELTTDWGCWTRLDFDGNADIAWERDTDQTASGDFSARHLACDNIQEGWLISPPLYLQPNRDSTWMQFSSMEIRPESHTYSGVWVSTTDTETHNFTEIWSQDNPSETWQNVSIDLTAFQGEKLYLAFKYSGHHGHDWYIDDIQVQENFVPRDTITTFPYAENFDNGLMDWYILDEDHSGARQNWKLFERESDSIFCLGHQHDSTEMQQKAWAISRPMRLENDMFYTLHFQNSVTGLSERDNSGLYIASDLDHTPHPDDFTPIYNVEDNTDGWQDEELNLNAYAGHDIYLAWCYDGFDHDWMLDSITMTARIAEYTITVVSGNPEYGEVTGGGTYLVHDTIQIAAMPFEGFTFTQWDDEDTANPRSVVVAEDHTYTALFDIQQCTITTEVTPEGAGRVEGGGVYGYGSTAILMAYANPGHQFTQWSDGVTDNPRSILVEGDASYTAEFLTFQYEITTSCSPEEGGTVTGAGTYYYGEAIDLQATPNSGYLFLCWTDGIPSNPRHVTVTQDAHFTAMFYEQGAPEYTITVQPSNPFYGTTTGSGVYPEGVVIQISAIPNANTTFTHWDDGNTDNPRTITVTCDMTYTAYFEMAQSYDITVVSQNPLMGEVYGGGTYREGETIQIGAIAHDGFYFTGWQDGDVNNPRTITVTEDATFVAIFDSEPIVTHDIIVYFDEEQGMVLGAGTYVEGTIATLAAIPADGYVFAKWSDGVTDNPRNIVVEYDLTLAAFFNSTGVEEAQGRLLCLYPNPANDKLHINGLVGENKIEIYDTFGTLLMSIVNHGESDINISGLASGLYVIRVGQYYGKFVKK